MTKVVVADGRETLLHLLPRDGAGMEVGVWRGEFSARILKIAQPRILHLVDPWRLVTDEPYAKALYGSSNTTQKTIDATYAAVGRRFQEEVEAGQVVIHRAASTDAFRTFPDGSLDFVYVDADHTFGAVLSDLDQAFRVVRPGGLICGDDYVLGGWWRDGVVQAFHQFVATHSVVIELLLGSQFAARKLKRK
jgi:SAM-dependent methyltransferase